MPEPLKNLLHQALVGDMADRIASHAPAFDKPRRKASCSLCPTKFHRRLSCALHLTFRAN